MRQRAFLLVVLMLLLTTTGASQVYALDLGQDITIFDKVTGTSLDPLYDTWWRSSQEDQEVEPDCAIGQDWDVEAFFLNGTELTMVGGYDFQNGVGNIFSGDIFIDVTGDVKYGEDLGPSGTDVNQPIKNIYGYDYVLDLNFTNFSYSVYLIDSDTDLLSGSLRQNDEANPWRYYDGGTLLGAEYQNVSFSYMTGLSDADVGGLLGDSHNAVIVDLSFLGESTEFTAHFTMQCTNDNLMGKGIIASESSVIPEPSTILLLGIGLIGTVAFMRKQGKKFIQ